MEQAWFSSLGAACAQRSPRPRVQVSRKPSDGSVSFLFLSIIRPSSRPPTPILRGSHHNCYHTEAFPSGPAGKYVCQKNFSKAGGERKIIKAAMPQLENRKAGSATKWHETPPVKFRQKTQPECLEVAGWAPTGPFFLLVKPWNDRVGAGTQATLGECHHWILNLQFPFCFSVFSEIRIPNCTTFSVRKKKIMKKRARSQRTRSVDPNWWLALGAQQGKWKARYRSAGM